MKKLKGFLKKISNKFFSIFGKSYSLGYKLRKKYPQTNKLVKQIKLNIKLARSRIEKTKNFLVFLLDTFLDFLSIVFLISLAIIIRKDIFLLLIILHILIRITIMFLDNLGILFNINILEKLDKKIKKIRKKTKFKHHY